MRRAASTPFNMVLSVVVTCAVSASALSLTYAATHERIVAQEKAAEERALREVLASAETFDGLEEDIVAAAAAAAGETPVGGIYRASDSAGKPVGWAVRCAPRGYGGPIQMVIGLDRNGKVTGASVITQNETPGLGTKVIEDAAFMKQFVGWDAVEIDRAAKGFDAISGATKSSNGIRKGVVAAGHVYDEVLADLDVSEGGE